MKGTVAVILVASAGIAVLLALGQKPFASASFEYGTFRSYTGTIEEWPAPVLSTGGSRYLLVGAGKHGVAEIVRGLDRKIATLQGSLIHRGPHQMLELLPGSLQARREMGEAAPRLSQGWARFTGEIVDTKCYLGVMNPGEGKVHRACAARCISGGAPPALAVKDRLLILVGADGRPINREILSFVGEKVSVSGDLIQAGALTVLRVSPKDFRRE